MHESHYRHAEAPSAPPLDGNTVATPMPEKAMRKEQEEGLISQYEHAQTRPKDDHIYAAPPPVYQSNGTKGYTQGYAMAVEGGRPGRRRRRQRSGCCCCLISFVVTLGTLILIAAIAALVVYLVVRPVKEPKYAIQGVEVREFNMTNELINTEMNLTVEARNENKKIGIDYDEIEVKVFYMEEEIGEGSIPGFYQGHKNTKVVIIPIKGKGISLTSAATASLQSSLESDASMWLATSARAKARIKIGRWKSRRHTFHVICSFQLSSSPHPGRLTTILSSSCRLKKRNFFSLIFGS